MRLEPPARRLLLQVRQGPEQVQPERARARQAPEQARLALERPVRVLVRQEPEPVRQVRRARARALVRPAFLPASRRRASAQVLRPRLPASCVSS